MVNLDVSHAFAFSFIYGHFKLLVLNFCQMTYEHDPERTYRNGLSLSWNYSVGVFKGFELETSTQSRTRVGCTRGASAYLHYFTYRKKSHLVTQSLLLVSILHCSSVVTFSLSNVTWGRNWWIIYFSIVFPGKIKIDLREWEENILRIPWRSGFHSTYYPRFCYRENYV